MCNNTIPMIVEFCKKLRVHIGMGSDLLMFFTTTLQPHIGDVNITCKKVKHYLSQHYEITALVAQSYITNQK